MVSLFRAKWLFPCIFFLSIPSSINAIECSKSSGNACRIQVTAVINNGCFISNTNPINLGVLDFGSVSAFTAEPIDKSLYINLGLHVQCTPGTSLQMSFDGGDWLSNATRRLERSGNYLNYKIYSDISRTSEIGVNNPIPINIPIQNTSDEIKFNVYGTVFLSGQSPPGSYHDTLRVTFTY